MGRFVNYQKGFKKGWSEPVSTNAPVDNEVVKPFWG
jgi:hypothetical protein